MVKVNAMRAIAAHVLNRESITGLILVLQSHITNQALKAVELFAFKVELFEVYILIMSTVLGYVFSHLVHIILGAACCAFR